MNPVRWGVLGAASIATSRFIPAMKDAASARLAGIASRDAVKAKAVAREFGIPRHCGSYEELLADPDIEAVYVPVPNHLHVEWAARALEAGKHVLCEKPLALAAADVATLIAARDRSGRHIEEAFAYRNHAQWRRIGELTASGAIGAPRAVQGTLAKQFLDPDDIRNNPDKGGGALYAFDPANHYTLQVERFSRYVRGDAVPSWPIEDALSTLAIIEALFASAKSGQWEKLEAA